MVIADYRVFREFFPMKMGQKKACQKYRIWQADKTKNKHIIKTPRKLTFLGRA